MKATVAYEAARRQKPHVKQLKWHLGRGYLEAKGTKGTYRITAQKPNRRLGVFKWCLTLDGAPVDLNGKPMSLDDRSELKAFASSYDAIPSGTVIAVNETPGSAKEAPCMACGHAAENGRPDPAGEYAQAQRMVAAYARHAGLGEYVPNSALPTGRVENGDGMWSFYTTPPGGGRPTIHEVKNSMLRQFYSRNSANESPTREEWEVVVSHPPAAHRGAIMSRVGPGEARDLGDRIILSGFHDDTEAANVASSIARQYKVAVTFGPKLSILNHAAEARTSHNFDEDAALELELYADNTAELYRQKVQIIDNLKKKMARGIYDKEKAVKLWMYWVDAAAKRYAKEFADGRDWHVMFGTGTRLAVAKSEEEKERVEMQLTAHEAPAPLA